MIEKKADNNDNLKNQIKQIDKIIDNKERQKKQLNSIKDSFIEINQISNKMIELLSLSIKGRGINSKFSDISLSNAKRMKNLTAQFDDDFKKINKSINDLYAKKNKIQKKLYKMQNEKNNKNDKNEE